MTRNAEHTPTGYEDAASVVVNQAPAPSSLAGGEVTMGRRAFEAMRDHNDNDAPVSMNSTVQWSELAEDERKRWDWAAKDDPHLYGLAALSPEAPAREGVEDAGHRLRDIFCRHARRANDSRAWSLALPDNSPDAFWDAVAFDMSALAPRHEAPASEGDAIRSHPCYGEHQPGCDCAIPTQTETEVPPFLKRMTDAKHEAPAEGAGELDRAIRRMRNQLVGSATFMQLMFGREDVRKVLDALEALRARSSAPEAREGEPVGYANAEFMRRLKNWREGVPNAIRSDETFLKAVSSESYPVPLYTHPAAPRADKLRIAVEALEPFAGAADKLDGLWSEDDWRWNDSVRSGVTVRDIRRASQALAVLKAEGAK